MIRPSNQNYNTRKKKWNLVGLLHNVHWMDSGRKNKSKSYVIYSNQKFFRKINSLSKSSSALNRSRTFTLFMHVFVISLRLRIFVENMNKKLDVICASFLIAFIIQTKIVHRTAVELLVQRTMLARFSRMHCIALHR